VLHDMLLTPLADPVRIPDVFVCHSTEDALVAGQVCAMLEARGVSCWIAPRDVAPGSAWDESILSAIDASKALVLILSSHANVSPFVKSEVNRAFARGKTIFTLRLSDVAPSGALELYVSRNHWTDAFPPPLDAKVVSLAHAILGMNRYSRAEQVFDGPAISKASAPNDGTRRRWIVALVLGLVVAAALVGGMLLERFRTSPGPELPAVRSNASAWLGVWSQSFTGSAGDIFGGEIRFTALDDQTIEARFESRTAARRYGGEMRGTAKPGGILEGTWSNEHGQRGRFLLALDAAGRSFRGTYALGDQSPASKPNNEWSGKRTDAP
jgi:hypothetical protein